MTTLVTGATGFIGGNLARALAARDEAVRVLVRPTANDLAIRDVKATRVVGDLLSPESLQSSRVRLRDGVPLRRQLLVLVAAA